MKKSSAQLFKSKKENASPFFIFLLHNSRKMKY